MGQINDFFAILDLKDDMWMKDTGSTYKVNIRFNDFYQQGETWDYPFGKALPIIDEMYPHGWMSWFALNLRKPDKFSRDTFARSHNAVGHLAWNNKLTGKDDNWNHDADTAYHMDAIKFGQWLKKKNYCEGLNYMQGDVAACEKNERGYITSLTTTDGQRLEYDLYIDCTGFKSLLLEQFMDVPFESFHVDGGGCLLNDRAVTCHVPHEDPETEVTNTTNCTAIENGWVWMYHCGRDLVLDMFTRLGSLPKRKQKKIYMHMLHAHEVSNVLTISDHSSMYHLEMVSIRSHGTRMYVQ